jgi:hypothetical protein
VVIVPFKPAASVMDPTKIRDAQEKSIVQQR